MIAGPPAAAATPIAHATNQVREAVEAARRVQPQWAETPLRERLSVLKAFRQRVAAEPERYAERAGGIWAQPAAEALASQVFPLLEGCRFLERRAAKILQPRSLARWSLSRLSLGTRSAQIQREPLGAVLIIAANNLPLFLPGSQALQAIAVGNAALIKPAASGQAAAQVFADALRESGLPDGVMAILPEAPEAGSAAIREGVDKVIFTGSVETGHRVHRLAADRGIPCTMELSGCDAAFVLPGADLAHAARAIAFGLSANRGGTCLAPRRIIIEASSVSRFADKLAAALRHRAEAFAQMPQPASDEVRRVAAHLETSGAAILAPCGEAGPRLATGVSPDAPVLAEGIFSPFAAIIAADFPDGALRADAHNPYALGASVFGPVALAKRFARRISAGVVTINDCVAPTADPALPFGGRGWSGFGVTRGAEGLLEMTALKTVTAASEKSRRHHAPPNPEDSALIGALIRAAHGQGYSPGSGRWPKAARLAMRRPRP
ncbi:MAG: aldehyde dehydrogenase family protein [Verrucomicrobiales bacterium]